jgi:hypothetical protein
VNVLLIINVVVDVNEIVVMQFARVKCELVKQFDFNELMSNVQL